MLPAKLGALRAFLALLWLYSSKSEFYLRHANGLYEKARGRVDSYLESRGLGIGARYYLLTMTAPIDPECSVSLNKLQAASAGDAAEAAITQPGWPRTRSIMRLLNFRKELFASTFSYGTTAVIKLGSSLVLTRLLSPDAYGVFGILLSFSFMVEMMSDVGTIGLLIRDPRGDEPRFVHTLWTIRLLRSMFNFALLMLGAPFLASLYHTPALTNPLRLLSVWFLLNGAESMSSASRYAIRKLG